MKDRALVLANEDMPGLLTLRERLEVIEEAYREPGHDVARTMPRRRIHLPLLGAEERWYWLNVIPAAVRKYDAVCSP